MTSYRHHCGTDIPPEELDRRLGESLCVWCGTKLYVGKSPDDMFCSESHQLAWQRAKYADFESGGTPIDRAGVWRPDDTGWAPSWLGATDTTRSNEPLGVSQDDLDAMPVPPLTDIPDLQLDHVPSRPVDDWPASEPLTRMDVDTVCALFNVPREVIDIQPDSVRSAVELGGLRVIVGPDLPPELDYVLAEVGVGAEPTYRAMPRRDERPGIIATPRTPRPTAQTFALGGMPWVRGGRHLVEELGPEPEPASGWPLDDLRDWMRHGWSTAMPDSGSAEDCGRFWNGVPGGFAASRECPRCGALTIPVPITAKFPKPEVIPDSGIVRTMITRRLMTKLCCAQCSLPYPGPVLLPVHRAHPRLDAQEYGVLSTRGHLVRTVTDEVVRHTPPEALAPLVWGELYREVAQGGSVWGCCHPGCEGRAHHWILLASALAWNQWLWEPSDGEALRMGLCPAHWYELQREVYTSDDLALRNSQWITEQGRVKLVVR